LDRIHGRWNVAEPFVATAVALAARQCSAAAAGNEVVDQIRLSISRLATRFKTFGTDDSWPTDLLILSASSPIRELHTLISVQPRLPPKPGLMRSARSPGRTRPSIRPRW